jgi:hypothetical protein
MAENKGLRRFDQPDDPSRGQAMPDTNPTCRTAFRCSSEIVRHPIGTLSGITPECCPPSPRNPVRHGAERAGKLASCRIWRFEVQIVDTLNRATYCSNNHFSVI